MKVASAAAMSFWKASTILRRLVGQARDLGLIRLGLRHLLPGALEQRAIALLQQAGASPDGADELA